MPDAFEREGLTPEHAESAIIAIPADDPRLLIHQAVDSIVAAQGGRSKMIVGRGKPPDAVGQHWEAATTAALDDDASFRLRLFAWDREAATKETSWPAPLQGGSWLLVYGQRRDDRDKVAFPAVMFAAARQLGGFLSFEVKRSMTKGGDVRSGWTIPDGDSPLEGVDVVKHRVLRTIGFDGASAVERILRSEAAKAFIAQAPVDEPQDDVPVRFGPKV